MHKIGSGRVGMIFDPYLSIHFGVTCLSLFTFMYSFHALSYMFFNIAINSGLSLFLSSNAWSFLSLSFIVSNAFPSLSWSHVLSFIFVVPYTFLPWSSMLFLQFTLFFLSTPLRFSSIVIYYFIALSSVLFCSFFTFIYCALYFSFIILCVLLFWCFYAFLVLSYTIGLLNKMSSMIFLPFCVFYAMTSVLLFQFPLNSCISDRLTFLWLSSISFIIVLCFSINYLDAFPSFFSYIR